MLVRHALLQPKRPAVIILSAATIRFDSPDLTLFYHIPENDKLVLAQYYGVPFLSLRGAAYHHWQTAHMSAKLKCRHNQSKRVFARRVGCYEIRRAQRQWPKYRLTVPVSHSKHERTLLTALKASMLNGTGSCVT